MGDELRSLAPLESGMFSGGFTTVCLGKGVFFFLLCPPAGDMTGRLWQEKRQSGRSVTETSLVSLCNACQIVRLAREQRKEGE